MSTHTIFFHLLWLRWFQNIVTRTLQILENVFVETFLLNRICYNFHMLFKNIEILLLVIFIRMDLQFIHINKTPDIKWTSPGSRNNRLVQKCVLTECQKYVGINCKIFVSMKTKPKDKVKHIFIQHYESESTTRF